MDNTASASKHEEIYHWLQQAAAERGIQATLHTHLAKEDARYLYLPVRLEKMADAYDRAATLQDLEDAWNNRDPRPHWRLLLVPAAS